MLAILRSLDHALFLWVNQGWSHPALDGFWLALSWLGSWPIALVTLAFLAARGGRVLRRHAAVLLIVAVGLAVSNVTLKAAIERPRPASVFAQPEDSERPPINELEHISLRRRSFPSGHSMIAFYFMVYLGLYSRRHLPCALALASLIAVARVYVGAHFPSDCVAGAGLGSLWALAAWRLAGFWERRAGPAESAPAGTT
ncbi:MAG: phosphatase PAP2 family protein [Kiritimatiellae bacterium]|nr:phosphatase PAP2 family protein [Kiritimatiellia bacterium]